MNLISKNIHFFYKTAQILYGELNKYLPPVLKLTPLVLRIRVTNKCNLHCSFCYLSDSLNLGERDHLEMYEWEKIINNLPWWTVVDITGAEPFLAKNFKQLMFLLLKRGLKVSITTNGQFIDPDFLEFLVKNNLYYLMVSIDGLPEYHNKIRGAEKSFERIERFLNVLEEKKHKLNSKLPHICIKSTVTDDNSAELIGLNNYIFKKYNIHSQSLNLMFQNNARGGITTERNYSPDKFNTGNTHKYQNVENIKKNISNFLSECSLLNRDINIKPNIARSALGDYFENPSSFGVKSCNRVHSIQTLYYDGTLTPCDIGLNLGNIKDLNYDLKKVWKLKKFTSFLNTFKKESPFPAACEACCLADQKKKL